MAFASENGLFAAETIMGFALAVLLLIAFTSEKGSAMSKFNPRPPRKCCSPPMDMDRRWLLVTLLRPLVAASRSSCLSSILRSVRKSGCEPALGPLLSAVERGTAIESLATGLTLDSCRRRQLKFPSSASRPHQSTKRPFEVDASPAAASVLELFRLCIVSSGPNCEFPRFRLMLGLGLLLRATILLTRPRSLLYFVPAIAQNFSVNGVGPTDVRLMR